MNTDNDQRRTGDRIETVLAGLRDANPAPGMEQRVNAALLRAVDAAPPAEPRSAWVRLTQLAGVTAALASLILLSVHLHRQKAKVPTRDRASVISAGASTQQTRRNPPHTSRVGMRRTLASDAPPRGAIAEYPGQTARDHGRAVRLITNKYSQTAHSAEPEQGFPAPPLPLTEQERLLIRLVHRDDPLQLAQLTPAAREAERQRDQEQTREFFKPPPMLAANFKIEPYPVIGGSE